ncbi:MAG: response regulator [Chloroflexales bacterium]
MVPRILQVDDDPLTLTYVGRILRTAGYDVVTARNGAEALAQVDSITPDLILLDVLMPGIDGYEVCRQLRRRQPLAHVPILMLTGHDTLAERLKGFDAGADNYLSKPVHPDELQILVKALLQRTAPEGGSAPTQLARTIAVFSLRGGAGVSSIAVNVAVGLAQLWGSRTTLVDLALTNGQSALMLDLPLRNTWAELAPITNAEIDAELLEVVLQPHASRVRVLAAPPRPDLNELITGEKVTHVLALLKASSACMVIDTAHDFTDPTLAGLDAADQIVLVVAPEMASVRAASCALKVFQSLGYLSEKVTLALNWTFERNGLARREIETSLGQSFSLLIPFAADAFVTAINTGVPPVIGLPKSPLGALFEDIAFMLSSAEQRALRPGQPTPAWQRVAQRAQQRQR